MMVFHSVMIHVKHPSKRCRKGNSLLLSPGYQYYLVMGRHLYPRFGLWLWFQSVLMGYNINKIWYKCGHHDNSYQNPLRIYFEEFELNNKFIITNK